MKPSGVIATDSPVSNNGRGLKLSYVVFYYARVPDSPVSNNGRGLKLPGRRGRPLLRGDSPVSNNGRGLKPCGAARNCVGTCWIRPLAITGVD